MMDTLKQTHYGKRPSYACCDIPSTIKALILLHFAHISFMAIRCSKLARGIHESL